MELHSQRQPYLRRAVRAVSRFVSLTQVNLPFMA